MNILDVDLKEVEARRKKYSDKLECLFGEIRSLAEKFNEIYDSELKVNIYTKEGQKKLKWTILCAAEELFELANCLKNRPWMQTEYEVDINQIYDELADTFNFLILLCLQLGLDPDKLVDIVLRKVIVNEFRIRSKY